PGWIGRENPGALNRCGNRSIDKRRFPRQLGPSCNDIRNSNNFQIMDASSHKEKHFTASATVRDIVIGMSDGLTVRLALAAGLSGGVNQTFIVITAGLAEIAAGSIAMGLGGYLSARSEAEFYNSERKREEMEVKEKTEIEVKETTDIL